jgi:hypothetical protein
MYKDTRSGRAGPQASQMLHLEQGDQISAMTTGYSLAVPSGITLGTICRHPVAMLLGECTWNICGVDLRREQPDRPATGDD